MTEEKRIDFQRVAHSKPGTELLQTIEHEINRVGYVCLTDCMSNRDRSGSAVLASMDAMEKSKMENGEGSRYRIRVLRDKWGKPVPPGSKVEWKVGHVTRIHGVPMTSHKAKKMERRGEGEKLIKMRSATVDKYGCIDVMYADASQLLNLHGVHFEAGTGICTKREVSSGQRVDEFGNRRHLWNWLYEEAPPWVKLPKWTEPEPDPRYPDGPAVNPAETLAELKARVAKMEADEAAATEAEQLKTKAMELEAKKAVRESKEK